MKTANDPRHIYRIKAVKALFAQTFQEQPLLSENELSKSTWGLLPEIDPIIEKCAPEWPLSQINKVDLSVLRLAVYELLHRKDVPTKVILDEAVEIAKRYGGPNSGSFVNGALATALKLTNREDTTDGQTQ